MRRVREVPQSATALAAVVMLVSLSVLFLATADYRGSQNTDTLSAAAPAWQLATHGNLNLDHFVHSPIWLRHGAHGLVSNRFPGVIFIGVPAYVVLGNPAFPPSTAPAAVTAALVTAAAMSILFLALSRLFDRRTAATAVLLLALGTATWTVSAAQQWTHGPNQMWLAIGMLGLAVGGRARIVAGFALAVFTRAHLVVADLATAVAQWLQRQRSLAAFVIAGGALGGLGVVAYNRFVYGRWTFTGGYQGVGAGGVGVVQLLRNADGLLVSPERGLLVEVPCLLLLLPGIVAAWRVAPTWVRSCAMGGVAYMLTQLWLMSYRGGDGFYGNRVALEMLTLATPLLAMSWMTWTRKTRARRALFAATALWSVGTHAVAAIGTFTYPPHLNPWRTFLLVDLLRDHGWSDGMITLGGAALAAASLLVGATVWRRGRVRVDDTLQAAT